MRTLFLLFLWIFPFSIVAHTNETAPAKLQFTPNYNQWPHQVISHSHLQGGQVFAENDRLTFLLLEVPEYDHHHSKSNKNTKASGHAFQIIFEGAQTPKISYSGSNNTYYNYFLGNDPACWATQVPAFQKVIYENLYEGIDLKLYSNHQTFKYDFIVQAGCEAADICLNYVGTNGLKVKNKKLWIQTALDQMIENPPIAYQIIQGQKKMVACEYALADQKVSFHFPDGYNDHYDLVIDPEIVFSTYTGAASNNLGFTATYDQAGNTYGGSVVYGNEYPTTMGAFELDYNGGETDIALSKFNADGTDLIYSTFIGGNGSEIPHSLMVNSKGELVVFGTTSSDNYPVTNDSQFEGGQPTSVNVINETLSGNGIAYNQGADIIVTVLNADGTDLTGSTFFGGSENDGLNNLNKNLSYNFGDDIRSEVALTSQDEIYIASCTQSADFPADTHFPLGQAKGQQEAIIAKFSANANPIWAATFGGTKDETAYGLTLAKDGSLYCVGGTTSDDLNFSNGLNTNYLGGEVDGFIIKIIGENMSNGTYLGTDQYEQCFFVDTDAEGQVYTIGQTTGQYPIAPSDVYQNANSSQFIHQLDADLNTTLFSTVVGAGNSKINFLPTAFKVNDCGKIYLAGWGGGVNKDYNDEVSDTKNLPTTPNAFQTQTDGEDLYFMVLNEKAASLDFGSYYGSSGDLVTRSFEHSEGGTSRFDENGTLYQAICAGCFGNSHFPSTANVYASENGSTSSCNLALLKINFDLPPPMANFDLSADMSSCLPLSIQLTNNSLNATRYEWDFGNGESSTEADPSDITYDTIGEYTLQLIAFDSLRCPKTDTFYQNITVSDLSESIQANFDFAPLDECEPSTILFNNTSQVTADLETDYNISWDFGDGFNIFGESHPQHTYENGGDYIVKLAISSLQSQCSTPDTFYQNIQIPTTGSTNADFDLPAVLCLPNDFVLEAQGEADLFTWQINGETFEGARVEQAFTTPENYTVLLTAELNDSCAINKSTTKMVNVIEGVIAEFDFSPSQAVVGDSIYFDPLNSSTEDILWDFGDGTTSTNLMPIHQYSAAGDWIVTLMTASNMPCSDSQQQTITINSANEQIGVPNAFSPNNDGVNDQLYVNGKGILTIDFKIFNRQGQMVFQTQELTSGWDGYYKGQLQGIGVFVFVLEATLLNGTTVVEKGSITLLH